MDNLHKEEISEIRNANVCMAGIIRKYIKKVISGEQALILITKELKRQGDYLKMLEENGM